jgi:hypothetical protein
MIVKAIVATLDTVRKIEMLEERAKFIALARWQKPALAYVDKLEGVSKWRNIVCHTPLIPDDKYGAAFIPTAAAKLLKGLQLGTERFAPAETGPSRSLKKALAADWRP